MDDHFLFLARRYFAVAYDKALSRSLFAETLASSVVDEPKALNINDLYKALGKIPASPPRVSKFISSAYAVRDTGKKTGKYIKRDWNERWFSLPWKPWKKYKLILIQIYEPVMYIVQDKLIYHPTFESAIRKMINFID